MKRKSVILLAAFLTMAAALTGCKNSGTTQTESASSSTNSKGEDGKIRISLWHVWPEANGGTAQSFAKTLEEVQEKFPEVEFDIDAVADSGDAYKTKIKTAVAGGELPDIFYTWGGGFSETFVESGNVLCLDDYTTDETKDKFIEGTTDFFTYDGGLYGYPLRTNVGVLFCNKAMFEKAGLEIPQTFDELLNVVTAFREQGITPFALGGKNPSDIAWWTDQLTERTAGVDYVNQILAGEATMDTPEVKQAAEAFKKLVDAGAFDTGAAATSRDEAYTIFTAGNTPMYFVGSWYCATIMASDIKDDVVVTNFPTIEGGKGAATEYLGGADQTFMINSKVENPEKVMEVYTYMCERFSENVFLGGAGLPAWKTNVDVSDIENTLLVDTYNLYKNSTGVNLWWDNALLGQPATEHMDTATKLFLGNITPDEFVSMNVKILK